MKVFKYSPKGKIAFKRDSIVTFFIVTMGKNHKIPGNTVKFTKKGVGRVGHTRKFFGLSYSDIADRVSTLTEVAISKESVNGWLKGNVGFSSALCHPFYLALQEFPDVRFLKDYHDNEHPARWTPYLTDDVRKEKIERDLELEARIHEGLRMNMQDILELESKLRPLYFRMVSECAQKGHYTARLIIEDMESLLEKYRRE